MEHQRNDGTTEHTGTTEHGTPAERRNNAGISGGIRVRIPQELDVVAFWSWNLDVVAFWSWNLDVAVYVPPRPRFRFH